MHPIACVVLVVVFLAAGCAANPQQAAKTATPPKKVPSQTPARPLIGSKPGQQDTCSFLGLHSPPWARSHVNWSPNPDKLECQAATGERSWPPSDYQLLGDLGYYKMHAFGVPWHVARKVCEEEGAHLLILNSEAEKTVIMDLFKKHPKAPGSINAAHVWTGIHERGTHGKFFTIFGDKLEDVGWLVWSKTPQQPNDLTPDDCVSFYSSGLLYDDPCTVLYGFVCEIEKSIATTVHQNKKPEIGCNDKVCAGQKVQSKHGSASSVYWPQKPSANTVTWSPHPHLIDCTHNPAERTYPPSDYKLVPGLGHYKMYQFGSTWHTARKVCEDDGAHLVIINSAAEADALKLMYKDHPKAPGSTNKEHIWTGIHERGTHGKFFTIFGDKLEDVGWLVWSKTPQQPNDLTPDDCVSYYSSGLLYDDPCTVLYGFVCEIEPSALSCVKNGTKAPTLACNGRNCIHHAEQQSSGADILNLGLRFGDPSEEEAVADAAAGGQIMFPSA